jgi:hypothetical protein
MLKKRLLVASIALAVNQTGFAADLYDSAGKLRPITMNDAIVTTDTVGGFAIYQGDGDWKFEQGKSSSSAGGSSTNTVPMASFVISQSVNGELFQRQSIIATIGSTGGSSWSGTPCSQDHLVIRNKARGREDHCMTIDPLNVQVGTKSITFLSVRITNSNGGRFYSQNLMINPNLLGNRDTGLGDWTDAAISATPYRRALMQRLTVWGEKFLDASIKAFDYSQPQDSFAGLPSVRSLLPTVAEFPANKYSLGFISLLEDLKHRAGPKALAYFPKTDTRTPNTYYFAANSQEDADRKAMEGCNQRRTAGDAECKLVPEEIIQTPVTN